MTRIERFNPPDDWHRVVITWEDMQVRNITRLLLDWVETAPGGQYCLLGFNVTEGFDFYFERAEDATMFALRWA